MKLLYVACFVIPTCTGFFAQIRDHFEKKLKKPDCHIEWEDVSTPHCETHHEQVCVEEYKNQCKTEYSTSCNTEYNTQCKTEYEELCETTDHQKCHTEHDQQCHDEYNEECKTEYSEQCWDEPREACHSESTEQCKDVPECWVEQQEECHTVQVKVHHHEKPKYQKWKRSSEEEAVVDGDVEVGVAEGEIGTTGGVTKVEGGEMTADGSIRKERSLHLLTGLAGAVAGSHVGKKLGLGVGLAIGLGSKKLALKKKEKVVHHKSHPKAVHHKVKHETVCNHVP